MRVAVNKSAFVILGYVLQFLFFPNLMSSSWNLVQFVIILFLPRVFRWVTGWVSSLSSAKKGITDTTAGPELSDKRRQRRSGWARKDLVVYGLLAGVVAYYATRAFVSRPRNVFAKLGIDDPFGRGVCRQMKARARQEHQVDMDNDSDGDRTRQEIAGHDMYYQRWEDDSGYVWYLVDRFCKYPADRWLYQAYGEDAYLDSVASPANRGGSVNGGDGRWVMWVYGMVADIGLEYVLALAWTGVACRKEMATSRVPGRGWWFKWGLLATGVVFLVDVCLGVMGGSAEGGRPGQSRILMNPWGHDSTVFYYESMMFTRRAALAVLIAMLGLADYVGGGKMSAEQMLDHALDDGLEANLHLDKLLEPLTGKPKKAQEGTNSTAAAAAPASTTTGMSPRAVQEQEKAASKDTQLKGPRHRVGQQLATTSEAASPDA